MENPAGGGAPGCPVGKRDTRDHTRRNRKYQAETEALVDALTGLPPLAMIDGFRARLAEIRRDIERERQRNQWRRFVRGRLRRPALTPAERRRAVPPITDNPGEALAAAWHAAPEAVRRSFAAIAAREAGR